MAKPFLEKNGKTWAIRPSFTRPNGTYASKYLGGYSTRREAQLAEGEYLNNVTSETKDMRFHALCDFVLETKIAEKRASKTLEEYKTYIPILKAELGNPMISNVSAYQMQLIKNKYSSKPGKCEHLMKIASAVFTFAFDKDLIEKNPMAKVTIKSADSGKEIPHYNKKEDLQSLLQLAKGKDLKYYCLMVLISSFGLRPSEAVAVTEFDVDKSSLKWTVKIDKVHDEILNEIVPRTKNKQSSAVLPFSKSLYDEITLYKRTNNINSIYLCCGKDGEHLTNRRLYLFLRRLFGKTKQCRTRKQPKESLNIGYITPYGFRHSFSNINKKDKKHTHTISAILRNDPRTLQEHYFHADDDLNRELIEGFSETILHPKQASTT